MDKKKEDEVKDPDVEEEEKKQEIEDAKKEALPVVVMDTRLLKTGDYELHVLIFSIFPPISF